MRRWRVMRRIIIVGCQGSGKTSLALKLGRKLGLPVEHLDVLYRRPGWKASSAEEMPFTDGTRPAASGFWCEL
jgi:shikimate kinase